MFTKTTTAASTSGYWQQIERLKAEVGKAKAILIGAGAGMSAAAGLTYDGERFQKYFADFRAKYGIADMYSGGFYPYPSLEEYWAWWSRHIWVNRYDVTAGEPYRQLLELVKDKDYFVLTTNVDHQFQLAGFDKERLFYTQGDYGLWQCSKACHYKTYDNEKAIRLMTAQQQDMRIPSSLIPRCPVCGAPMAMNLRCDDHFVEDAGWHEASRRYDTYVATHTNQPLLLLELGVGNNTPGIIKYPFWLMTARNPQAVYACINNGEAVCPREISGQSLCINRDIARVLADLGGENSA